MILLYLELISIRFNMICGLIEETKAEALLCKPNEF